MRIRPALLTVLTFFLLALTGSIVLHFFGFRPELPHGFIDAAFTAVSAVCVTGLTVVDLSKQMPFQGQLLVLILIQVGGLGVLTLSNWILLALKGRVSLGTSVLTRETFGGLPRVSPRALLVRIVLFTFATEAIGASLLYWRFSASAPPARAAWLAIFHAVSAFCNAGFSLFSDSLVGFHQDVGVNVVVMGLIFAGGIGFVAAVDVMEWIRDRFRGDRRRLHFHTQVVLRTTAVLILGGALLIFVFEWGNSFSGDSAVTDTLQSLFLSVTARTAGFNTVDTGHLTNMSLLVLMVLMVIGASPGSTGGGVKTTSFIIITARVKSYILNREHTELLRHSVPREIAAKAMAMVMLYALVAFVGLMLLQATEFGELPHDLTRGAFVEHMFEVISALSTVGLSTGVTPQLSNAGLSVLMGCMLVGRVGPLVLAASVIGERTRLPYTQPEGDVMVG